MSVPNIGDGGDGGDGGNGPCRGDGGDGGDGNDSDGKDGSRGQKIAVVPGVPGSATWLGDEHVLALTEEDPDALAAVWDDLDGDRLDWLVDEFLPGDVNAGVTYIRAAVHPNGLNADRIRFVIEFRVNGAQPLLDLAIDNGPTASIQDAIPILGDADWKRLTVTAVRPVLSQAFGPVVDMFEYENRDIEVRLLEISDFGKKGDLDQNGVVEANDFNVVASNMGATGHLQPEDGDANADGVVDADDAVLVINAILEEED